MKVPERSAKTAQAGVTLSTDSLFKLAQFLIASPSRGAEETLNNLCVARPDLAHRMRVVDGVDAGGIRERISRSFLGYGPHVSEAELKIPSVAARLLTHYYKSIVSGDLDSKLITHYRLNGFNFSAGKFPKNINQFSKQDQKALLSWIKERVLVLLKEGHLDEHLLYYPENLLLRDKGVDQALCLQGIARLNRFVMEATDRVLNCDVDEQPLPDKFKRLEFHLSKEPLVFAPLSQQVFPLTACVNTPLPSAGEHEIFIERLSNGTYAWRFFDDLGQVHDDNQFNLSQEAVDHYVHFLAPHDPIPRYGQSEIFIKRDAEQNFHIKIFDEKFGPGSPVFKQLGSELVAFLSAAYSQAKKPLSRDNRTKLTKNIAQRICKTYGTGKQRALLEAVFSVKQGNNQAGISSRDQRALQSALLGERHSIRRLSDDYITALIQKKGRPIRLYLPQSNLLNHPNQDICVLSKKTLLGLIEVGSYDFEFSFFASARQGGNREDYERKQALLHSTDREIAKATVNRISRLIETGKWDGILFSNYDYYQRDDGDAFEKVELPELKTKVAQRIVSLMTQIYEPLGAEEVNPETFSRAVNKLLPYIKLGVAAHQYPDLVTVSADCLKNIMHRYADVLGDCSVDDVSLSTHSIETLFKSVDLTSHPDSELAQLSKAFVLNLISQGKCDDGFTRSSYNGAGIYYKHQNSDIQAAVNKRVGEMVEAYIAGGKVQHLNIPKEDLDADQLAAIEKAKVNQIRKLPKERVIIQYMKQLNWPSEQTHNDDAASSALKKRFVHAVTHGEIAPKILRSQIVPAYNIIQAGGLDRAPEIRPLLNRFGCLFDEANNNTLDSELDFMVGQSVRLLRNLALSPYFFDHEDPSIRNAARPLAKSHVEAIQVVDAREFKNSIAMLDRFQNSSDDIDKQDIAKSIQNKLLCYLKARTNKSQGELRYERALDTLNFFVSTIQADHPRISEEARNGLSTILSVPREEWIAIDAEIHESQLLEKVGLDQQWCEALFHSIKAGDYDEKLLKVGYSAPFGSRTRLQIKAAFEGRVRQLIQQGRYDDKLEKLEASHFLTEALFEQSQQRACEVYVQGGFDDLLIQKPWFCPFSQPEVKSAAQNRLIHLILNDDRCLARIASEDFAEHQDVAVRNAVRNRLNQLTNNKYYPNAVEAPEERITETVARAPMSVKEVIPTRTSATSRISSKRILSTSMAPVRPPIVNRSLSHIGQSEAATAVGVESVEPAILIDTTQKVAEILAAADNIVYSDTSDDSDMDEYSVTYSEVESTSLEFELNERVGAGVFELESDDMDARIQFKLPLTYLSKDVLRLNHLSEDDQLCIAISHDKYDVSIRVLRDKETIFEETGRDRTFPIGYKVRGDVGRAVEKLLASGVTSPTLIMHEIFNETIQALDRITVSCFSCGERLASPALRPVPCSEGRCQALFEQLQYGADFLSLKDEPDRFELVRSILNEAANVDAKRLSLIFSNNWPMFVESNDELNTDTKRLQAVLASLAKVPTAHSFPKTIAGFNKALKALPTDAQEALGWLLPRTRNLLDAFEAGNEMPSGLSAFRIINDPEKEQSFDLQKQGNKTRLTYHGTAFGNVLGVLTNGLQKLSGTGFQTHGAVYGEGVYHSDKMKVAMRYSPATSLKGHGGQKGVATMRSVFVCENVFDEHSESSPQAQAALKHNILVEPNPEKIILRALLAYDGKTPPRDMIDAININTIPKLLRRTYVQNLREQANQAIDGRNAQPLRSQIHLLASVDNNLVEKAVALELADFETRLKREPSHYESIVLEDLMALDQHHPLLTQPVALVERVLEPGLDAYLKSIDDFAFQRGEQVYQDALRRAFAVLTTISTQLRLNELAGDVSAVKTLLSKVSEALKGVSQQIQALTDTGLAQQRQKILLEFNQMLSQHQYFGIAQLLEKGFDSLNQGQSVQSIHLSKKVSSVGNLAAKALLGPFERRLARLQNAVAESTSVDSSTIFALQKGVRKILALKQLDAQERDVDWQDYSENIDRRVHSPLRCAYDTLQLLLALEIPNDSGNPEWFPRLGLSQEFTQAESDDELIYFYAPSVLNEFNINTEQPSAYILPASKLTDLPNKSLYERTPRLAYHRESEAGMLRRLALDYASVITRCVETDSEWQEFAVNAFHPGDACAGARHQRLHEYLNAQGLNAAIDVTPDVSKDMSREVQCQNLLEFFQRQTRLSVGETLGFARRDILADKHNKAIQMAHEWSDKFTKTGFKEFVLNFADSPQGQDIVESFSALEQAKLVDDLVARASAYEIFS